MSGLADRSFPYGFASLGFASFTYVSNHRSISHNMCRTDSQLVLGWRRPDVGRALRRRGRDGRIAPSPKSLARISHQETEKPPHRAIKLSVSNNLMAAEAAA
jgi:hypothetical protein